MLIKNPVRFLALVAILLVPLVTAPEAQASTLWSWVPSPFPCQSANNNCVAGTGFNPQVSYAGWGQDTNRLGNCTNYIAYRVGALNGGANPHPSGDASTWKDAVVRTFGQQAANLTPKVGSVAWWGANAGRGSSGHLAYVEQVNSDGSIDITESVWNTGSGREVLTPGTPGTHGWPQAFLHIQDAPGGATAFSRSDGTYYRASDSSPWVKISGQAQSLAMDGTRMGIVNSDGAFYRVNDSSPWIKVTGGANAIAVSG